MSSTSAVQSGDLAGIDFAPFIDHSLLTPTATPDQIAHWCMEADRYGFASVCISPCHVRQARELLQGKSPKVGTVIGFPSGATTSTTKLYEAQEAVENGATELDVVINLSWVKQGETGRLHKEIAAICEETGQTVKAILEMTLLTPAEKQLAAEVCLDAGVAFLKTSTGWHGGATVEDVALLQSLSRGQAGVKASAGIRTPQQAMELLQAGATRLGTSRGPELLRLHAEALA
jgi:deoxyribose-phosphate aldolase